MELECLLDGCKGVVDFGELPEGAVGVRARCPECLRRYDLTEGGGMILVEDES
jgi:hypothetical protein